MLKIMPCQIQRSIVGDIQSSLWYFICADETVDASVCEQVGIIAITQYNGVFVLIMCRLYYVLLYHT